MRNKNAVSKSYLSDSQRFAQICNNQLFGSRRVIEPERLRELDTGELAIIGDRAPALEVLEKYMSGMAKTDRLMPVITLTVYWGKEAWDGAKSLYEMLDIPPVLSQYKDIINDYRMNLLEVHSMENLEAYSGELKALFGFVRYQKDKTALKQFVSENEDIFQSLTPETIRAIERKEKQRACWNFLQSWAISRRNCVQRLWRRGI